MKKRQAAFGNTNAQGAAAARCCSRASHRQSPWHRRRRCYCRAVKRSESDNEEGEKNAKKLQKKSETNVKQHSATQTHKVQLLYAAVHAHHISDRHGTVVTDVALAL